MPGTFAYSPAAGTVLNAGAAQTLSVTFTPTDSVNYASATASVAITVGKTTPTITWGAPADIAYGTALGAAQLNATASVPGTFVYSPPVGTVLAAGGRTLSVTFTPTDATSYASTAASVAITVSRAMPAIAWIPPATIVYGTPLGAPQLNATASVPGAFAYTPPAGSVLPIGPGQTLALTFTPFDAVNYATATATTTITVLEAKPAIDALVSSDQAAALSPIVSPAFSTSAPNELVLAFIATDFGSGTNTSVTTVTGAGLAWVLVGRTNVQSGTSEIWRAFATAPLTNVTVAASLSQPVSARNP